MTDEEDVQEYNYEIYDDENNGKQDLYIIVKDDAWKKTKPTILLEGYLSEIDIDKAIKEYE
jgi:hypothetical protein